VPIAAVRRVALASLLVDFACTVAAAQYGHPLKGSWSGDWGVTKESRNRLLLEFNWDGKAITGTINPGPNAVPLRAATLDPSTWTLHAEAEGKDASGRALRYVIDGRLENLGAYNRVLSGTWTQGAQKGDFRLVRN
jgi:hypothetical protein